MNPKTIHPNRVRLAAGSALLASALLLAPAKNAFSQHFKGKGEVELGKGISLCSGASQGPFRSTFDSKSRNTFFLTSFGHNGFRIGTRFQHAFGEVQVHTPDLRPDSNNTMMNGNSYGSERAVIMPTLALCFPKCSVTVGAGYAFGQSWLNYGIGESELPRSNGPAGYFEVQCWTSKEGKAGYLTATATGQASAVREMNMWPSGSALSIGISYTSPSFTIKGANFGFSAELVGGASNTVYFQESMMMAERLNKARMESSPLASSLGAYSAIVGGKITLALGRFKLRFAHFFTPPKSGQIIDTREFDLDGATSTAVSLGLDLDRRKKR